MKLNKVVRLGKAQEYGRKADVFCKIEINDGNLSITGVIGPKSNGDAVGGCGQIDMNPPKIIELAPGWTDELLSRFWDTWHKWHLNDMRAGCEHQRESCDPSEKITLYYFRLSDSVEKSRRESETAAKACIAKGETFTPTAEQTRIALLPAKITLADPVLPPDLLRDYVPNGPHYAGDHYNRVSEEKTAGWVHPEEHPKGLLCKPCPVCGYKYGSQWLREELPADVVEFLKSLPDADITPAWV